MPGSRDGRASEGLGAAEELALRLVTDRLVTLGDEGMAGGVDDTFDIDTFVERLRKPVRLA